MNSRRISILFPSAGNKPVGGIKVMLQYANEFAKSGDKVRIIYSCYYSIPVGRLHKLLRLLKYALRYLSTRLKGYSCKKWFKLASDIEEHYVWSLYSSKMPEAEYYFATAAVTANALNRFPVSPNNKFYFIQGYEPWQIGESGLYETYKIHCQKIAVSAWLKKIADGYGQPTHHIPNGFDNNDFYVSNNIEERSPYIISILYHELADKGFAIGLEALKIVKSRIPELKVFSFGVFNKPAGLPNWFEYFQNPDKELHNRINNEASIYMGTSTMEGYGLTVGEAMLCGQAVVCTNNPGYLEMAIPNINAIVCPVGDAQALADAAIRLINDNELRITLAKEGTRTIQGYTISKSFNKLRALLK